MQFRLQLGPTDSQVGPACMPSSLLPSLMLTCLPSPCSSVSWAKNCAEFYRTDLSKEGRWPLRVELYLVAESKNEDITLLEGFHNNVDTGTLCSKSMGWVWSGTFSFHLKRNHSSEPTSCLRKISSLRLLLAPLFPSPTAPLEIWAFFPGSPSVLPLPELLQYFVCNTPSSHLYNADSWGDQGWVVLIPPRIPHVQEATNKTLPELTLYKQRIKRN